MNTKKNRWIIVSLLGVFVICGIFLRSYKLADQSYWMDEGYTINAVLSVVEKGNTILDSGYNYSCPFYCYPTAWITNIFGLNAFSFRLLSVLAGIFFILFIFHFSRKLFNTRVALITSFLTTFSYWQIAWSRQARWYTLFMLFFWVTLYFFYQYLYGAKKKGFFLILTFLFTGITIMTHRIGYLLIPICILWVIVDYIVLQKKEERSKKMFLGTLIGFVGITFFLEYILHVSFIPFVQQLQTLQDNIYSYLFFFIRQYWVSLIFVIVALNTIQAKDRRNIAYLLFPFGMYCIVLSFFADRVEYRYMFHLTPVFFILAGCGIDYFLQKIEGENRNRVQKIKIGIPLALGIIFFFISGQGVYFPKNFYMLENDAGIANSQAYAVYTPQPNWNGAYQYIKDNRKKDDIIISSQPQLTKIFLQQAGYFLKYNNLKGGQISITNNGREYYVNAKVLTNLDQFKRVTANRNGYVVVDYLMINNTPPKGVLEYISEHGKLEYYEKTNAYSEIWVYRF